MLVPLSCAHSALRSHSNSCDMRFCTLRCRECEFHKCAPVPTIKPPPPKPRQTHNTHPVNSTESGRAVAATCACNHVCVCCWRRFCECGGMVRHGIVIVRRSACECMTTLCLSCMLLLLLLLCAGMKPKTRSMGPVRTDGLQHNFNYQHSHTHSHKNGNWKQLLQTGWIRLCTAHARSLSLPLLMRQRPESSFCVYSI